MRTRYPFVSLALLAVTALVGRTSDDPRPPELSTFVGESVARLESKLPEGAVYVTYDVSYPVLGKQPRYGTADGGDNADWMVVAACGSVESLAVGVLHKDDHDQATAEAARQGKFDDLLAECDAS